ncbi:hypothetical protein QUA07_15020 [Microcoleus sp. T3_A4]
MSLGNCDWVICEESSATDYVTDVTDVTDITEVMKRELLTSN